MNNATLDKIRMKQWGGIIENSTELLLSKNSGLMSMNARVHETCINHKLANIIAELLPRFNVDLEYDLYGENGRKALKSIRQFCCDNKTDKIRPDICVHIEREDFFNLMVWEIKYDGGSTKCALAKLRLLTSKEPFNYRVGIFLQIPIRKITYVVRGEICKDWDCCYAKLQEMQNISKTKIVEAREMLSEVPHLNENSAHEILTKTEEAERLVTESAPLDCTLEYPTHAALLVDAVDMRQKHCSVFPTLKQDIGAILKATGLLANQKRTSIWYDGHSGLIEKITDLTQRLKTLLKNITENGIHEKLDGGMHKEIGKIENYLKAIR